MKRVQSYVGHNLRCQMDPTQVQLTKACSQHCSQKTCQHCTDTSGLVYTSWGGGEKNYLSPLVPTSQSVSLLLTMHTRQFGDCFAKGPGSHDSLDPTSCFAEGPGSHDPVSCFEGDSPSFLSATEVSRLEMRSSSPNLASWSRNKLVLAGSWLQC